MSGVVLLAWRPVVKNSLRGFAKIQTPGGLIMNEIAVNITNGRPWAAPAARPMVEDGQVLKGPDGKAKWVLLTEFATKELRDKWSDAVVRAVAAAHPDALKDEAGS